MAKNKKDASENLEEVKTENTAEEINETNVEDIDIVALAQAKMEEYFLSIVLYNS